MSYLRKIRRQRHSPSGLPRNDKQVFITKLVEEANLNATLAGLLDHEVAYHPTKGWRITRKIKIEDDND